MISSIQAIALIHPVSPGLRDVPAAPAVPHTIHVQALPQASPQVQGAHRLLRHGYPPRRDHAHADHPFRAALLTTHTLV